MSEISNQNNNIFSEIKQVMIEARNNVASIVNVELLKAYWQIGRIIVEDEQNHQDRADYGKGLIKELSKELTKEFGRGFSRSNLQNMRNLYLAYPKSQTLSGKLSWSHYCELLSISDLSKRSFYEKEAELDDHLDYEYGDKPLSLNTRNGYSSKKVKGTNGEMDVKVPRDRDGSFEPQVIKKHEKDISNIESQIISMYGRGMTTRDISAHIQEIYGFGLSESTVTKITNKILPTIEEWRQRPLEKVYPFVFMDAIHYNVRDSGAVVKKAVYIVLAYTMDGVKEVLGMYVGENESSKYWLLVLNDLKNRGLEDVLIFATDNLPGFSQAITAVYPKAEIQKCIIHQIRSSTRYVNYKDSRELMNDLKTIYKANTEETAIIQLDFFDEKWGKKYPSCVSSWRNNWAELSTVFKYPPEIRKLMYTTDAIENFNRQQSNL